MATTGETNETWIPELTFGARLALVRQRMGWNIKEAATACGLPAQSWRGWEVHSRVPHNFVTIAMAIATRTGADLDWLVYGPSKPGGKVNVDYPLRVDPLASRIVKRVGAEDKIPHGDFRKKPNGRALRSDGRTGPSGRTVSLANHTAPMLRGTVS